ncbi:MAG: CdaR family protein [Firmicutes bacterium]|nr:CdaR family protein [Bacillota bacterium]
MRRRRSLLQSNTFARLFSLALGFSLWVVVNSNFGGGSAQSGLALTTAVVQNIPVDVLTSPHMIAVSVRPRKVSVSVSGSIIEVAAVQVESAGLRAVAKALTLGPGVHQVPLVIANGPYSTATYTPDTATVEIDLQPSLTVKVTPQVQLTGHPQTGLTVGRVVVPVDEVRVTGPSTLVHQVSRVVADVNVSGAQNEVVRRVAFAPLDLVGRPVPGLILEPAFAVVRVPIHGDERTVSLAVSLLGKPASGFAVSAMTVQPPTLQIFGNSAQLQGVPQIVLPPINVAGWKAGRLLHVTVPLPFQGSTVSVPSVTVAVSIGPSDTATLTDVPVQVLYRKGSLTYALAHPVMVAVTVSGPAQTIANLTSADVQAFVTAAGGTPGKAASLAVQVAVPQGCQVSRIVPSTVEVSARPSQSTS